MDLTGIHHLTAVTADASGTDRFYRQVMGMRRVKKTVNQDDTSSYHLFYADGAGSAGTDLTFFDWPTGRERRGTRSVSRTGLRIDPASLDYWAARLREAGVEATPIREVNGRATLDFEDPEGQRLRLTADAGHGASARPWDRSPVPAQHQILGLGPITMAVRDLAPTRAVLTDVMNMRETAEYADPDAGADGTAAGARVHVFEMGPGETAAELHVSVQPSQASAAQGAGGVHHVAFRVPDAPSLLAWSRRVADHGMRTTGEIDRFYFRSLYFREPGGVLFELATDGPGFAQDEPAGTMGEALSLPPHLEPRRAEIEAQLKPID